MGIDLNADLGEIWREFRARKKSPDSDENGNNSSTPKPKKSKKTKNSNFWKTYKKLIIIICILALTGGGYVIGYAIPHLEKNARLKTQISDIRDKESEIAVLDNQRRTLERRIRENAENYRATLTAFDDSSNLDDLYDAISTLGLVHGLSVANIRKNSSKPYDKKGAIDQTSVDVKLRGRFSSYMAFKHDLLAKRPLLTIQSEALKSPQEDAGGILSVHLKVTTYTIDKKPFFELLARHAPESLGKLIAESDARLALHEGGNNEN